MFNNIEWVLKILSYVNIGIFTIIGFILAASDDAIELWLLCPALGFLVGYLISLILLTITQPLIIYLI